MHNYLYPLVMVLALAQCNDFNPKPRPTQFDKSFTLENGSQVTLKDEETSEQLTVKVDQVYDSRCPTGAMCVTMGNATVILSISNEQERKENINLCIGACHPEPVRSKHTLPVQLGSSKYNITLKDVKPYPGLEDKSTAKTVEMIVSRSD